MDDDDHRLKVSSILAELNGHVRDLGVHFAASEGAEGVFAFVCECGAGECKERVVLSLGQFDALQRADGVVFAVGHELSRAQLARRRALTLCEEARALAAQADHQNERARRNVSWSRGIP
jgi:hypothetical protein